MPLLLLKLINKCLIAIFLVYSTSVLIGHQRKKLHYLKHVCNAMHSSIHNDLFTISTGVLHPNASHVLTESARLILVTISRLKQTIIIYLSRLKPLCVNLAHFSDFDFSELINSVLINYSRQKIITRSELFEKKIQKRIIDNVCLSRIYNLVDKKLFLELNIRLKWKWHRNGREKKWQFFLFTP